MVELRVFTLDKVIGGDTYEIAYAHSYPKQYWSKDSLYFADEEDGIGVLSPYFDDIFKVYAYYGDQKITLLEWQEIEKRCRADYEDNASVDKFFTTITEWIEKGNRGAEYFWILGI